MNKNWITIVTKHHLITAVVIFASMLLTSYARAESNILFIIDASNSMHGQVGDESKMAAAKRVLGDLLKELPAETRVGLMAYGNSIPKDNEKACSDINILSPVGAESADAIVQKVNDLQAKGQTPIAAALNMSTEAFKNIGGENNHVILISDGLETCGGDPCQAAKLLTEANINARVHVIGFDVSAEEQTKLECISKMGNGKYFKANNAEELKLAVAEVRKVVEAKVKPTEYTEVWRDDFNGEELAEHWEIINPDPDAYIVEEGKLLSVTSGRANFAADNLTNLFRLNKDLPEGDWVITAKLDIDFQSNQDRVFFGLYKDKDNYLVSVLSAYYGSCNPGGSKELHLYVTPTKAINGKITDNAQAAWKIPRCDGGNTNELMAKGQPYLLRIEKKGRIYTSSIKMEGDENPKWVEFEGLKLLRPKGNISIGAFQSFPRYKKSSGEVTFNIDWVKIETPDEVAASSTSNN